MVASQTGKASCTRELGYVLLLLDLASVGRDGIKKIENANGLFFDSEH